MRSIFAALLLLLAVPAFAQYGPPPPNLQAQSTVGFWAAGKTSYLSASTTSANIALSVTTGNQVEVFNSTTAICFVAFGYSATTAAVGSAGTSTSDYPVAPGSVVVVTIPAGATYAAAILSTGSGAVYFTPGLGL